MSRHTFFLCLLVLPDAGNQHGDAIGVAQSIAFTNAQRRLRRLIGRIAYPVVWSYANALCQLRGGPL